MNYQKIYNLLIESRIDRVLDKNEVYENHHIIPISLGGKNIKENKVFLTYREHFIAHKLLFLFSEGADKVKMGYALHRLCTINNKEQKYRISGAREFEKIKKDIYEFIKGKNHPLKGRKMWSDDEKTEMSIRMRGDKNPFFGKETWNSGLTKDTNKILKNQGEIHSKKFREGKIDTSNYGVKTKGGRKNISDAQKCKAKTEEHKKKISHTLIGRKLKEETRIKMSQSRRGKPQKKIKCPYCGKVGGTTMYRWHFDNCKFKNI